MSASTRIHWRFDLERRFPFGTISPDSDRYEMIGFPPPWPLRDLPAAGAELTAEGTTEPPGGFVFRRWRFNVR